MTTPEQEQPIPAAVAGGIRTTDPPEKRRRRLASLRGRLGVALTLAVAALTLTTAAIAMLAVALLTLFRKRRFYTEVMTKRTSQAILRILRVRLVVHRDRPYPERQTIYISNHTSVLDLFILLDTVRTILRGNFAPPSKHVLGSHKEPVNASMPAAARLPQTPAAFAVER